MTGQKKLQWSPLLWYVVVRILKYADLQLYDGVANMY